MKLKNILLPLFLGIIISLTIRPFMNYDVLNRPPLSPPAITFPIVWTILYILMGLSYLKEEKKIYYLQLTINLLWPIFFFALTWYLLSSILVVVLIILVSIMIYRFYKINKVSAYLNIPYLIWLFVALYLSIGVYILN